jgi:hypothetical protein
LSNAKIRLREGALREETKLGHEPLSGSVRLKVLCYTAARRIHSVDFSQQKAEIRSEIDKWHKVLAALDGGKPVGKKRTMSATARKRISAAQKAR